MLERHNFVFTSGSFSGYQNAQLSRECVRNLRLPLYTQISLIHPINLYQVSTEGQCWGIKH